MKFIDRLLPFLNKEVLSENMLTGFWVLGLLAIFFIAYIYLSVKWIRISINIKYKNIGKKKKLRGIWQAYQSSFSNYGGTKKTVEFSESYFNEQNILYASMNLRVINNVSNILIGLGILGTFVGLTYGIADSNFETTEAIKSSINNLLSGMGTAFVSSIWGMGLSLIFTMIFKLWQSNVSRKVQRLCLILDKEHKIKQQDLEIIQQEKQKTIINELFNEYLVADTDEGKQLPKNVFRQLLEESVKQTASLQTFSDDLGDSISNAMEKLVEDNSQQISQLIEDKLVPVLEDLKEIKQDSGTKVIEDAVERLADSMKSMMDDFKSTITGDTKQELEGLTERLTVVSESLINIPETMTDITLQVTEVVESLKETVLSNIEQSKIEAAEQNANTKDVFVNATSEYKSTVEEIQDHMELLLSTQKDNIKQVSALTEEINSTLKENSQVNQQFDSMIQKSKIVAQLIESVSNKFENSSTAITETSEILKANISDFGNSVNNYVVRNDELLDHQERILNQTEGVSENYAVRFETIEAGLEGIFEQIQTGLKDYQNVTAENLNKYLTQFSSTLTAAQQGLESNVSNLNEITEELVDQIEKMGIRR